MHLEKIITNAKKVDCTLVGIDPAVLCYGVNRRLEMGRPYRRVQESRPTVKAVSSVESRLVYEGDNVSLAGIAITCLEEGLSFLGWHGRWFENRRKTGPSTVGTIQMDFAQKNNRQIEIDEYPLSFENMFVSSRWACRIFSSPMLKAGRFIMEERHIKIKARMVYDQ